MDFESYGLVLAIHSTLRWIVLAAGFAAAGAAWAGRLGSRNWIDATTAAGRALAAAMDLQLVAGLVLYVVLSPTVASALTNMDSALEDASQRFWLILHPVAMIAALVLAHVGVLDSRRIARRDGRGPSPWYFTLALALVLAALPWPFARYGRPLLPSW